MHLFSSEQWIETFSGYVDGFTGQGVLSAPPVESVQTDDILKSLGVDQVVMKIDVEGSECKVRPRIYKEEQDRIFDFKQLFREFLAGNQLYELLCHRKGRCCCP